MTTDVLDRQAVLWILRDGQPTRFNQAGEPLTLQDVWEWTKPDPTRAWQQVSWVGDVLVTSLFHVVTYPEPGAEPQPIFETAVLRGPHNGRRWECHTLPAAIEQHAAVVRLVKEVPA